MTRLIYMCGRVYFPSEKQSTVNNFSEVDDVWAGGDTYVASWVSVLTIDSLLHYTRLQHGPIYLDGSHLVVLLSAKKDL